MADIKPACGFYSKFGIQFDSIHRKLISEYKLMTSGIRIRIRIEIQIIITSFFLSFRISFFSSFDRKSPWKMDTGPYGTLFIQYADTMTINMKWSRQYEKTTGNQMPIRLSGPLTNIQKKEEEIYTYFKDQVQNK